MVDVVIADNCPAFRTGLNKFLNKETSVVGEADGLDSTLTLIAQEKPQILLLGNLWVSDKEAVAYQLLDQIYKVQEDLRIVSILDSPSLHNIVHILERGVEGVITRDILSDELKYVIFQILQNHTAMSSRIINVVIERLLFYETTYNNYEFCEIDPLTDREREVLEFLVQGLSNLKIAKQLSLTEGTVKTHVSNIFRKLQVENRVQAVLATLGAFTQLHD